MNIQTKVKLWKCITLAKVTGHTPKPEIYCNKEALLKPLLCMVNNHCFEIYCPSLLSEHHLFKISMHNPPSLILVCYGWRLKENHI
jgi:hypothetical protein